MPLDITNLTIGMAISKPILEQTLPEFDKQMSVNGMQRVIIQHRHTANLECQ